jgi:hypothetical protein
MRQLLLLTVLLVLPAPIDAADPLSEARRLYNLGQYDEAVRVIRAAGLTGAAADRGRVVLGRIHLERYRRTADPADLSSARAELRTADVRSLDPRERVELAVGLAEALYFEDRYGAAAEMFDMAIAAAPLLGAAAHERILDWWATALDKLARSRPAAERAAVYDRIAERMTREIVRDPGSLPAGYWLVAAARGRGDLDRAFDAAAAGWVRALLARDRGVLLRADIDRLMLEAIIPERAARVNQRDPKAAIPTMTAEWEAFKTRWTRNP